MQTHSERDAVKGCVVLPSLAVLLLMSLAACLTPGESEKEGRNTDIELAKLAENHCAPMEAWIAQNKDNLPATYDDVLRFPAECRKFLYLALPPAAQSTVWRTQIERYRTQHPALNSQQRAVLDRGVRLLSPSSLGISQESPEWSAFEAELGSLYEQSINAFGKHETGILFAQIGPGDEEDLRAQLGGRRY